MFYDNCSSNNCFHNETRMYRGKIHKEKYTDIIIHRVTWFPSFSNNFSIFIDGQIFIIISKYRFFVKSFEIEAAIKRILESNPFLNVHPRRQILQILFILEIVPIPSCLSLMKDTKWKQIAVEMCTRASSGFWIKRHLCTRYFMELHYAI